MIDYLNIGPVPCEESCVQVGDECDYNLMQAECQAYKHQLIRVYGEPPIGANVVVKRFSHDFGTYMEVCAKYDEDNDEATDYAFKLESGCDTWDEEAKAELTAKYPNYFANRE